MACQFYQFPIPNSRLLGQIIEVRDEIYSHRQPDSPEPDQTSFSRIILVYADGHEVRIEGDGWECDGLTIA